MVVYQDSAQRYNAASSLRQARLAVGITAVLGVPIWAFFMLLGTALWALSVSPAGASLAAGSDADNIVPRFALTHLPPGCGGIVLAGVLAAAMSSLDSSMNSVAGVITTDWVQRLHSTLPLLSNTRARFQSHQSLLLTRAYPPTWAQCVARRCPRHDSWSLVAVPLSAWQPSLSWDRLCSGACQRR